MFVAFQREIARLDQLQPLRLINTGLGELRHTVADHQFRHRERLTLELFIQHVQMVFIDVGITDEIGEPARRVTGQATDQAQQRGAFGEVERRAQTQIIGADVQSQRDLFGRHIRVELVQQVARRQGHFVELGHVPAVEQDAAAARVLDDGVDALADLVDRLVQHHVGLTVFFAFGDLAVALTQGLFCLLYTSPSPRDQRGSRMPSSA